MQKSIIDDVLLGYGCDEETRKVKAMEEITV